MLKLNELLGNKDANRELRKFNHMEIIDKDTNTTVPFYDKYGAVDGNEDQILLSIQLQNLFNVSNIEVIRKSYNGLILKQNIGDKIQSFYVPVLHNIIATILDTEYADFRQMEEISNI